jgi:hypothetical protein
VSQPSPPYIDRHLMPGQFRTDGPSDVQDRRHCGSADHGLRGAGQEREVQNGS